MISQWSKCQSMVIKSLTYEAINMRIIVFWEQNIVNYSINNLFFGHMGFDFIWWWNNDFLMMFTKIIGIYEYSLPWYLFWSSVRDLLISKMCSFTKLLVLKMKTIIDKSESESEI